ncbi:MAG: SrfA family protein [Rhodospirillaceae bacterium]
MSTHGPLLRSGHPRAYKGLGVLGRPVFSAAQQMRATIRRKLGPDVADILAIPQSSEAGDSVSWYAPFEGRVVPWSSASPEERADATRQVQEVRAQLAALSAQELATNPTGDRELFGRMLPLLLQIPDDTHVHLVGGRPVLTFWGFQPEGAPADYDIIRDLSPVAAVAMQPAVPPEPATAPVPVPMAGRPWWAWLLWLLFLLLLLALLLFGLRGCGVAVPGLALPSLSPSVEPPSAPRIDLPHPDIRAPERAVPVPGAVVPSGALPSGALPNGALPDAVPPGPAPEPPASTDRASPDTPTSDELPPNNPTAVVPPEVPRSDPPADAADPGAQAPPALTIPPEAIQTGSTDFLNGHWRSSTGLVDSQTGRPIDVEYDFQDGKGTATIERSDGVRCTAPTEASMRGGTLVIEQTSEAACPNGDAFNRSTVECRPGADGRADCTGLNAEGGEFTVQIQK